VEKNNRGKKRERELEGKRLKHAERAALRLSPYSLQKRRKKKELSVVRRLSAPASGKEGTEKKTIHQMFRKKKKGEGGHFHRFPSSEKVPYLKGRRRRMSPKLAGGPHKKKNGTKIHTTYRFLRERGGGLFLNYTFN